MLLKLKYAVSLLKQLSAMHLSAILFSGSNELNAEIDVWMPQKMQLFYRFYTITAFILAHLSLNGMATR